MVILPADTINTQPTTHACYTVCHMLPRNIKAISAFLERLPGIGSKTASRLAFYMLRMPEGDLKVAAEAIAALKSSTKKCTVCMNLTEDDVCIICSDPARDQTTITVIEDVIDMMSFESGDIYSGLYHVLHGRIDPLNSIGPDDIYIDQLIARLKEQPAVVELLLATNLNMEGEATATYVKNKVADVRPDIKVTRLAYGLPIGANLEYADYMTLKRAIEGRRDF